MFKRCSERGTQNWQAMQSGTHSAYLLVGANPQSPENSSVAGAGCAFLRNALTRAWPAKKPHHGNVHNRPFHRWKTPFTGHGKAKAFPHPANSVSHSSMIRPVIHIPTMPASTAAPFIRPFPHAEKAKKNRSRSQQTPASSCSRLSARFLV